MLPDSIRNIGHSANVQAVLRVAGEDFPLASIGPDFCILRDARDIATDSQAEIIVTVDGISYVWDIVLTQGAVPFEERIAFATG